MKYLNQVRRYGAQLVAAGVGAMVPVFAFAGGGGTYDGITSAVNFSQVATAVVAIAALLAVALVAKKGARMVLGMIGR